MRFLCICVQSQRWSIFGWVPEFTNYHFNHYPQRRGQGVKRPKKIVKILLPMFRQGCLLFTGRGSRCERERKLWCLFQTEEESAFFTQQFPIDRFSRGKRCAPGGRDSWAGKQEGSDGSDPTTSCPALSHNSPDHTFRKCVNRATQRKENFTSKYEQKLRFGKFWVGHDAGFSHLSHQRLYNFPYVFCSSTSRNLVISPSVCFGANIQMLF